VDGGRATQCGAPARCLGAVQNGASIVTNRSWPVVAQALEHSEISWTISTGLESRSVGITNARKAGAPMRTAAFDPTGHSPQTLSRRELGGADPPRSHARQPGSARNEQVARPCEQPITCQRETTWSFPRSAALIGRAAARR
jgi:hypothetical protein